MTRASQLRMQLFRYFPALPPNIHRAAGQGSQSPEVIPVHPVRVLRKRSARLKGALLLSHTFGDLSRVLGLSEKFLGNSAFGAPQPSRCPLALGVGPLMHISCADAKENIAHPSCLCQGFWWQIGPFAKKLRWRTPCASRLTGRSPWLSLGKRYWHRGGCNAPARQRGRLPSCSLPDGASCPLCYS